MVLQGGKMDNLTHYLATTLRTLRHQRGWSLSRLAEISEFIASGGDLGDLRRLKSHVRADRA
ncbi:Transcriptional regulator yidN, Cro/CI family [Salmonella enterica subsp. enterica serovar Wandsworth str. A4-580]|uniref:Transcriptional regulator yidN, Cro/CI family n=1 Tax=Salmonella enterica subsp. enterica serovar Wandsworth str. A4-580 TaxID=913086 RepID=G5SBQ3_SALET|nr:Transcriptional regulator yidN, Cro/CI family [Salmonella enterica subsp. enterica serovar Wandsworth str. A4-580]